MPPDGREFSFEMYTPEGPVFLAQVTSVVFPGADGMVGVLWGRAPMVSMVGAGPLTLEAADGSRRDFFIRGGFVRVGENKVTVLAEQCVAAEDISPERAYDEITLAREMPGETDEQRARRQEAIDAARIKFHLAQKHHGPTRRLMSQGMPEE